MAFNRAPSRAFLKLNGKKLIVEKIIINVLNVL